MRGHVTILGRIGGWKIQRQVHGQEILID